MGDVMDLLMEIKVINLDSRPDRWNTTQEELDRNGFKNYQRFSALTGGDKGCMLSHIECLKGEGDIFIFEDDVVFEPDFEYWFGRVFKELPADFDLFYLGANVKSPAQKFSEHLWSVTE